MTVSSYSFGQDSHKVLHRFKAAGGGHRPQYLMGKMSKLHCKKSMWSRRGFCGSVVPALLFLWKTIS